MTEPVGRLAGKIAIVTGAASGFGKGIARRFTAEGAKVVIADLNEEGLEKLAKDIGATPVRADVTEPEDVDRMIKAAGALGGLDILINNAGFTHRNTSMLEVSDEEFDRIFNVNVKAVFLAAKRAIPLMRLRGGGVILNTASTAGLRPRPGLVAYNSSKGAVISMTKSMAIELAPEQIRVNALCPVAGETGMLPLFMGEDTPEMRDKFRSSIPIGRLSTPRDMANAALYLASDEADFITGVALEVDGGRCI
ncbi:3-oxoacyl-[acyl-carrier protein] reductase [Cohaesibacter sp. ES.047]|uniref:glucose 1-dehydrogenase n=1 Tax=Cohaesibacter sp. ES.047 TaxID=1798205 RepID=UPI000BB84DB5|nr:glucose 1-dehydrogenase [Cohaesibacter sp. ES.047]SNY91958.1 3-oxoacyl-[acyl-carrier protein] reductase [Cohaesibacter sp. ES.047]